LEADQEEENEEAGDMNDDELNELLARSEDESRIFRELDSKRERETLETWRTLGNKGKPPAQLMQLEELPSCYKTDEPFLGQDTLEDLIEGRGQRKRNVVSYNDGLDDDTWAMVSKLSFTPFCITSAVFCLPSSVSEPSLSSSCRRITSRYFTATFMLTNLL
jgi:hypothetical protein